MDGACSGVALRECRGSRCACGESVPRTLAAPGRAWVAVEPASRKPDRVLRAVRRFGRRGEIRCTPPEKPAGSVRARAPLPAPTSLWNSGARAALPGRRGALAFVQFGVMVGAGVRARSAVAARERAHLLHGSLADSAHRHRHRHDLGHRRESWACTTNIANLDSGAASPPESPSAEEKILETLKEQVNFARAGGESVPRCSSSLRCSASATSSARSTTSGASSSSAPSGPTLHRLPGGSGGGAGAVAPARACRWVTTLQVARLLVEKLCSSPRASSSSIMWGFKQTPTVMMALAFGFLYWFLPNTSVRMLLCVLGRRRGCRGCS